MRTPLLCAAGVPLATSMSAVAKGRGARSTTHKRQEREHCSVLFDEGELIVDIAGSKEADAPEVEAEAVDGLHSQGGVLALVVLVLEPSREGTIEGVETGQVEITV